MQLPGDPPISIVSYFVLPPNLRSNDNDEFAKVLAMFDRFVDIPLFDGTATSSTGKDSIKTPEVAPTSGATPPITSSISSLVGGKSVEIFENYGAAVPIGTGEGKQADSSSNSAADIALTVSQESDRKDTSSDPDSSTANNATSSTPNASAANRTTTTSAASSTSQPATKPATLSWADSMRFSLHICIVTTSGKVMAVENIVVKFSIIHTVTSSGRTPAQRIQVCWTRRDSRT